MTDAPHTQSEPWTVQRLLAWTADYLSGHDIDEPRLAAEILLAYAMSCARIQLYARFDHVPVDDVLATYRKLVRQAGQKMPIAYLVGRKEFFSLEFEVTPDVLIPRPETEILVEKVIDFARNHRAAPIAILEIGTGSGCIIISLLKYLSEARGVATDVSAAALQIARRNAQMHQVSDRIEFVCADALTLDPAVRPEAGFTCLVSNPPYISVDEFERLDPTVRDHEPRAALTDEADGLSFYHQIANQAPAWLAPGGAIFLETADDQAEAVRNLFAAGGQWRHDATWRDLTGPHERAVRFSRSR